VAGSVAGWSGMTIPTMYLVQKICTNNAQNYSVITGFMIKNINLRF